MTDAAITQHLRVDRGENRETPNGGPIRAGLGMLCVTLRGVVGCRAIYRTPAPVLSLIQEVF